MEVSGIPEKIEKQEAGADQVGENGGESHALHGHLHNQDEKQVQEDIQDAGDGEADKRRAGVAPAPENRRFKVIEEDDRQSDEVNAQVEHRTGKNLRRDREKAQERVDDQLPQEHEKETAQNGQQDGGVHGIVDAFLIPRADASCDHHVGAQRNAGEQIDQEAYHRAVAADGRHGGGAGKAPHHGDIRGIEQLLENSRSGQRKGHHQDFISQRAVQHVNFMSFHSNQSQIRFE